MCYFHTCKCFKCGEKGHLQSVCKVVQKTAKKLERDPNRKKHIEEDKAESSEDDFALWAVTGGHREGYHVHLHLNDKPVQMELNTGAAVSVIL